MTMTNEELLFRAVNDAMTESLATLCIASDEMRAEMSNAGADSGD